MSVLNGDTLVLTYKINKINFLTKTSLRLTSNVHKLSAAPQERLQEWTRLFTPYEIPPQTDVNFYWNVMVRDKKSDTPGTPGGVLIYLPLKC